MSGNLIGLVDDVNTSAARRGRRFHDPQVSLVVSGAHLDVRTLLQLRFMQLEAFLELLSLIWEYICFGDEVEVHFRELLLHSSHVDRQSILSSQFYAIREMVDLLVQVQPLIKVALALCVSPKNVPVVTICLNQAIDFK